MCCHVVGLKLILDHPASPWTEADGFIPPNATMSQINEEAHIMTAIYDYAGGGFSVRRILWAARQDAGKRAEVKAPC